MKYGYRYSLKRLLTEKFELDKPLDTSLEDWKGYFEKAEDLDSSIKDDFLTAREMADEAIELLDAERDNIVAAMEELEAKKKELEAELKAKEEKSKQEDKKVMTLLQRLNKRGEVDDEEFKAGEDDFMEYMKNCGKAEQKQTEGETHYFTWGMENNRMDVCNQVMWWKNFRLQVHDLAKQFAFPNGAGSEVKSRGVYPQVQRARAVYACLEWVNKKMNDDFFWQGDFPAVEKLIEKVPPPRRLGKLG